MGKTHKHLTQDKRSEIYLLHAGGKSRETIAKILGVHKSTISRELKRNKDPDIGTYLPAKTQVLAQQRRLALGLRSSLQGPTDHLSTILLWVGRQK